MSISILQLVKKFKQNQNIGHFLTIIFTNNSIHIRELEHGRF